MQHARETHDRVLGNWNGTPVEVTARLLPLKAFFAASIDVQVAGQTRLRTGGVFKLTGQHEEEFVASGHKHKVSVAWGKAAPRSFPVTLRIDDVLIAEQPVPISNWYFAYWPWLLLAALLGWQWLR